MTYGFIKQFKTYAYCLLFTSVPSTRNFQFKIYIFFLDNNLQTTMNKRLFLKDMYNIIE